MNKIRSMVVNQAIVGEPERRGDERSEAARSGGSPTIERAAVPVAPDPEVSARHTRRRFTTAYKLQMLRRADACNRYGELGALLRKEGLYSSHLITWRQQRTAGLTPKKRGRKTTAVDPRVKKLEYCPQFPDRFGSIEDGRAFCQSFFRWYNHNHHHSGLGFLEPAVVHFGQAAAVRARREVVLAAAYVAHPERFVNGPPRPADLPTAVWINPPVKTPARQDALETTIVLSGDQQVATIHEPHDDVGLVMMDRSETLITEPLVVESRRSAVAYRTGGANCARRLSLLRSPRSPSLRFSSPLIEPGVQVSRTRLSDEFHAKACAGACE